MSDEPSIIVGIDVGTSKVCTLIAELVEDDQLEVIGVGIVPSRGMKKGLVVNTEEVVESIQASVLRAEQQSGFKVISAYVGISGAHIQTSNSQGVVAVRHADRQITDDDVERAVEAARVASVPSDREVVQVVPRHFVVDGQDGIKNPVGMLGHRIEVQTTLISGARTSVSNLSRCVERVGVERDSLVLQALAAGESVLTEAERDLGVVLVDIGGGTTDVAVFVDGALTFASVLPVGGFQVSNDIAVCLRTPYPVAEEIKIRHGHAVSRLVEDDRPIDLASYDAGDGRPISPRTVSEIIEPRMEETFELVRDALRRAGFTDLPAGVVLCGGTAQLPGLRRLASEIFGGPVRVGVPGGIYGLTDQVSSPAYATSVGLLRYGLTQAYPLTSSGPSSPLAGVLQGVRSWFRNLLP